ncbi:MAG: hypothetical protein EOR26_04900 [Mesorhizobium sp.]|uniref:hypothetical protein n=1 Tax=unclassified Mesorhizobium TaxID=325217 RepID=UPI000FCA57B9|nr:MULTISPECIES: hypothetical protein [unclassified Mesorhizobium]RUV70661.1 hypothetical protein EOA78_19705 [Mesorhizobium sp. M5C.F.Cr.IN.023.01.1.1]RWI51039.1 MAG: hypothetical protein EOR15_06480 [Mesorhizobium sp.]RWI62027.1 MAG: hypothetical protein EOR16_03680 [Mesorhizobium sp.]RWJ13876.1 MAG: hypothetical protein EOR24_00930 [Mesorhizobium sp.]RWJ16897.1 MAG: hypothetical protein EOR25_13505 [Mesorhizobium sp.]
MANEIRDAFNEVYADGPSGSASQPDKSQIRSQIGGGIQTAVDGLDARVGAVEGTVGGIPGQIDAIEGRVDIVETRMDDVEDIVLSGIKPPMQSVRLLVTTATDPATMTVGSTLDGLVLVANDRVARATPAGAATDGVYVVQASGAALRSADMDTADELAGARFDVDAGTHAAETWALQTLAPITVGTTSLLFVKTTSANATTAEVQAARGGEPSLSDRLDLLASRSSGFDEYGVAVYKSDNVALGGYYAERSVSVAVTLSKIYAEVISGEVGASVDFYMSINDVVAYGPVTVVLGTPLNVSGLSIAVGDGDQIVFFLTYAAGNVKEFFAKAFGEVA